MFNLHKRLTYAVTGKRISVQQQTLIFYIQGHFLFAGKYFSHNNFQLITVQKIADFLNTVTF
jgi:hypothetical protein